MNSQPLRGRFAPSPTSDLHLGNLRTALLSWLFARSTAGSWQLRIEDLDQVRVSAAAGVAKRQIADLQALGLAFDGDIVWQSAHLDSYHAAITHLDTYPCYCTRREIAQAAAAPHENYRSYPGTCRNLSRAQRNALATTRTPAIRVRAHSARSTVTDRLFGEVTATVDDFVLLRNDGTPAYNLAVVVDDLAMGIEQVVRGDDLLPSAPRQAWLAGQLGGRQPTYAHVPLAVNAQGKRLAKRDGAVCLADLTARKVTAPQVLSLLSVSLGLSETGEAVNLPTLLQRFDPDQLPRSAWVISPAQLP
jgi:glutamyl-tRNA synthetase